MSYKVFISFTGADEKLAVAIKDYINEGFNGDINYYLSATDMETGQEWKDEIKKELNKSQAIISIVTANSLSKPWIYIEWSAFWMSGLPYYILITPGVKEADLINPMKDRNFGLITDVEKFKSFIKHLGAAAKMGNKPLRDAKGFISKVKRIIRNEEERKFKEYVEDLKSSKAELSGTNKEKSALATKLLKANNSEVLKQVYEGTNGTDSRVAIVIATIKHGNVQQAKDIIFSVKNSQLFYNIIVGILANKIAQDELVRELIDFIASDNNSVLKNVANHFISSQLESSELFRYTINSFTNMTALERVAETYIDKKQLTNPYLLSIAKIIVAKHAKASKNLITKLLEKGFFNNEILDVLMGGLYKSKREYYDELLVKLEKQAPEKFKFYQAKFDDYIELIHHISLPVADLSRSDKFFKEILHLKTIDRPKTQFDFKGLWYGLPNGQHLHVVEKANATYRTSRKLIKDGKAPDIHFAFKVSLSNFYKIQQNILKLDIPNVLQPFGDDILQFYILDPDNNIIEITASNEEISED